MTHQFDFIIKIRSAFIGLLNSLTTEQLNKIPDGFNNNIIWNFAHLLATQQALCYKLSGLPAGVDEDLLANYRTGTRPNGFVDKEAIEHMTSLCLALHTKLVQDYNNNAFVNYKGYTTSLKITLPTIEEAITFSGIHDGIHLGYAMALKHVV